MTNESKSKNGKADRVGKLIAGAKKHFPNGSQNLTLEGASMTVDAAVGELQTFIDNRSAVVAAQATVHTKVAAERAAETALNAFIRVFIAFVRLTFGSKADVLADFGLAPPKARAPQTSEQKAIAAEKRKATRQARGTTSAKAKKDVHGNITATLVVTPNTPPEAAAPEATAQAPAAAQGSLPTSQPKG